MSYFIVFEGIDGSGKSTQAEILHKYLLKHNKEVILTQEPWNGGLRKQIKEAIKSYSASESDILNMFLEDRTNHLDQLIIPSLEQGIPVICDRYLYSTLAYQQSKFPLDYLVKVSRLHLKADLCLYVDVPVEVGLHRIRSAQREEDDKSERYENKNFLEGLRKRYLALTKDYRFPEIELINGKGSEEKVFELVLDKCKKLI
jgi:dTMP kinase